MLSICFGSSQKPNKCQLEIKLGRFVALAAAFLIYSKLNFDFSLVTCGFLQCDIVMCPFRRGKKKKISFPDYKI